MNNWKTCNKCDISFMTTSTANTCPQCLLSEREPQIIISRDVFFYMMLTIFVVGAAFGATTFGLLLSDTMYDVVVWAICTIFGTLFFVAVGLALFTFLERRSEQK